MKRDIQNVDDDIARKKRKIEQILYSDEDIVEILNDPDIDPSCPEELVFSSIYPFIRIPGTQDVSKNFICFSVDDMERMSSNSVMKSQYIQFAIFVHKDNIKTKYGMNSNMSLLLLLFGVWPYEIIVVLLINRYAPWIVSKK